MTCSDFGCGGGDSIQPCTTIGRNGQGSTHRTKLNGDVAGWRVGREVQSRPWPYGGYTTDLEPVSCLLEDLSATGGSKTDDCAGSQARRDRQAGIFEREPNCSDRKLAESADRHALSSTDE